MINKEIMYFLEDVDVIQHVGSSIVGNVIALVCLLHIREADSGYVASLSEL